MNEFYLKVKKLHENGNLKEPAKIGDCGYDAFAAIDDQIELLPHERYNIPLGIALEFPDGWYCEIKQKSGLSRDFGLDTIGNVIDCGYRGVIHAQVVNTSNDIVVIFPGQKICQLVFMPFGVSKIEFVEDLSDSERGETGFGSTGLF